MQTNDHLPLPNYLPAQDRYSAIDFNRCGTSGLKLSAISLGLWHNFGDADDLHVARKILRKAFDLGITHIDLANNYGPPYGSAEENFGRFFAKDFKPYRDQLIISSKAGYDMWEGPYGKGGSKKYIMASCEQSLKRMGLDYVDIFYHHCPDGETPVDETMEALAQLVKQGKALYAGISNYHKGDAVLEARKALKEHSVSLLINQLRYSIFDRGAEAAFDAMAAAGVGCIAFSPLAQGILAGRYLNGVPNGSRASNPSSYLNQNDAFRRKVEVSAKLKDLASDKNISLAGLSLAWVLQRPTICSALIGASSPEQLEENVASIRGVSFTDEECARIDAICQQL
ncbi:MAG: aldo/keto reductase [Lentisphaeria bacterium]